MNYGNEVVGMMEGAYFVSRSELLTWLNELLDLNYNKIEQTASGAAHCQVLDYLYPNQVPLQKVNFSAKHEYEFERNWKVLQSAFTRLNIVKAIDINKLVKAKYQDNLEFVQWMKCFFDRNNHGQPYDARARREEAIRLYNSNRNTAARQPEVFEAVSRTVMRTAAANPNPNVKPMSALTSATARGKENIARSSVNVVSSAPNQSHAVLQEENHNLKKNLEQIQETVLGIENERDYYFKKLRNIEILCQTFEDQSHPLVSLVFKELYEENNTGHAGTRTNDELLVSAPDVASENARASGHEEQDDELVFAWEKRTIRSDWLSVPSATLLDI